MSLTIEDILAVDEWTDAERASVQESLRSDPELAVAFQRWLDLSKHVRQSMESHFPARQALVLLACKDRWADGDLTDQERTRMEESSAQVDRLLTRHPSLDRILHRIREDADAFEAAWENGSGLYRISVDRDAIPATGGPLRPTRQVMRLVRRALAAAAVVAVLVVGRQFVGTDSPAAFETWQADVTWQMIDLEDGSSVRLGPGSTLQRLSDATGGERRYQFEGHGFFDVEPNTAPFIVESPEALTTVLGTSFAVQTDEGTRVTLFSGRVSMASRIGGSVILEPGQLGRVDTGMQLPSVEDVDLTLNLSWTELLIFRDTPMSQVAERLSETFDVSITLDDRLKDTPLTGTFESDRGMRAILDIVAAALGATVTDSGDDSFHLSPDDPS